AARRRLCRRTEAAVADRGGSGARWAAQRRRTITPPAADAFAGTGAGRPPRGDRFAPGALSRSVAALSAGAGTEPAGCECAAAARGEDDEPAGSRNPAQGDRADGAEWRSRAGPADARPAAKPARKLA